MTDNPIWSKENTAAAFDDPQIGDVFSEMAAFYMWVVYRKDNDIVWATANPPCTVPQDAEFHWGTLKMFRDSFSYKSNSGYWVRLCAQGRDMDGWLKTAGLDQYMFEDIEEVPFGWLP